MAIIADYHTHTKYSRHGHGKGTIEENVRVAFEKGLRQVGISDHGFNQKMYGVRRKDIEKVINIFNQKESLTGAEIKEQIKYFNKKENDEKQKKIQKKKQRRWER